MIDQTETDPLLTLSDALSNPGTSPIETLNLLLEISQNDLRESSQKIQDFVAKSKPRRDEFRRADVHVTSNLNRAKTAAKTMETGLKELVEGGRQASKDVLELEKKAQHVEDEILDLTHCLDLRRYAAVAAAEVQDENISTAAADAIKSYREIYAMSSEKSRIMADCDERFRRVERSLVKSVLQQYETSVGAGDLESLSHLTPLIGILDLADQGVSLYLKYSKACIDEAMSALSTDEHSTPSHEIIHSLAKVFNTGVTHLRHHLPMVAHALGSADGDVGLVQLVNAEVEKRAVALLKDVTKERDLPNLCERADEISSLIEEKCVSGEGVFENDFDGNSGGGLQQVDDCGFSQDIGEIADLDSLLDEVALVLQYSESYERFIRHAADEVEKARKYRIAMDKSSTSKDIKSIEVLDRFSVLNEVVTEIGGFYSELEKTLMLAGMQRAFYHGISVDSKYYTEVATSVSNDETQIGSKALQTSLIEETFFAAQNSTRRAYATGQTSLACAATNFCADALGRLLREVLVKRADICANTLKPGQGLLIGQGGIGQSALAALSTAQKGIVAGITSAGVSVKDIDDPQQARREIERAIARACASYNDIEIAINYTKQLESQFMSEIEGSFPEGDLTEQLLTCITGLGSISKDLDSSLKRSIENLSNLILPRVRAIVNEAVGHETTGTSSVGGVTVGVISSTSIATVRMNYDLDEDGYELSQAGDGYLSRM